MLSLRESKVAPRHTDKSQLGTDQSMRRSHPHAANWLCSFLNRPALGVQHCPSQPPPPTHGRTRTTQTRWMDGWSNLLLLQDERKLNGRVERARAVFSTFQHHFKAVRTKRRWWLWRELETLLRLPACLHPSIPAADAAPHSQQHTDRARPPL
jgi:hypothetical protein